MEKKLLIGTDPEFFLIDEYGKPQTVIGLIGGTKHDPKPIGRDCYIQEDGVAAEFNVPPSNDPKELFDSIKYTIGIIESKVQPLGLKPHIVSSVHFSEDQLMHPQALELGCDPDYDAWSGNLNNPPQAFEFPTLRTAAGHVHIGLEEDVDFKLKFVRALDLFLGVPSILFDKDNERRKMYGKAGCFRFKNYGVEYRTLSNFWINSLDLIEWIYEGVNSAYEFVKAEREIDNYTKDRIIEVINNNNEALAEELIAEYNLEKIKCVV